MATSPIPRKFNPQSQKDLKSKIGVLILVVSTFALGVMFGQIKQIGFPIGNSTLVRLIGDVKGKDQNIELDFDLFWSVWNTLKKDYVDEDKVDEKEMFYGAIKGIVNAYGDPATIYLDPEETESFNKSNAGTYFSGIGAELGYENGQIVVITPIEGSPAEGAGVLAGDIIMKVDGKDIEANESIFDVVLRIRGEKGTKVTLTVLHSGATEPVEIEIIRGDITVPSMEFEKAESDGRVGVVDISRFTEASLDDWEDKWDQMVGSVKSSGVEGLIIDLRGNPGGYFDAAVYAASDFLKKGTTVSQQEDREGRVRDFDVEGDPRLPNIPVVVLVNEGSASASEILAGALKLNNRAYVIGEKTYGKGTAQNVIPFADGSSLHITVLKWLLPDGSWLNRDNPITPDQVVEISDEQFKDGEDPQMDAAIEYLQKQI